MFMCYFCPFNRNYISYKNTKKNDIMLNNYHSTSPLSQKSAFLMFSALGSKTGSCPCFSVVRSPRGLRVAIRLWARADKIRR